MVSVAFPLVLVVVVLWSVCRAMPPATATDSLSWSYLCATLSGAACRYSWCFPVTGMGLILKVRSYLRTRAGLPPVTAGHGVLNQGHRVLYERELLFLLDVLPKDAVVHDGLQLLDGENGRRHLMPDADVVAATPPPTVPAASAPATASFALPQRQGGVVLPTPPHVVRLAPLPVGVPVFPGSQAAREGERRRQDVVDDEEDEEICPVSAEYAAQWRAYHAARC